MTKNPPNPDVDFFFTRAAKWQDELAGLRTILLGCPLKEELKWGVPCYTLDGTNIVLIHAFKDYCALLFFKGALLSDPQGRLVQQTQNVQAARQLRFTSFDEIAAMRAAVKAYVKEVIAVEKAGLKVAFKETADFAMPDEFLAALERTAGLKAAFDALTPGRQRAYLLHFSSAKQAKTREARIEKSMPQIFAGKGLDDKPAP